MKKKKWKHASERWLSEKSGKKSIGTDRSMLFWINTRWKDRLLEEVTAKSVRKLAEEKKAETSASTANRTLALIKALLRASVEWGWLDRVPPIKLYPLDNRRVRWLTREEARKLIGHLPEDLKPMVLFSLATGLRRSNVFALEWSQVDLVRNVAWIHGEQSKSGKPIGVPLNETACAVLKKQKGQSEVFVFPDKNGKARNRLADRAWRKALRDAGIENFRWHDLRHTWASWHVQSGTPIPVLQELGGWHSYAMVLRYAHLAPEHLAKWAGNSGISL